MAYDEALANRIRELVGCEQGIEEKRMFGGLAFLINGNMSVAASGNGGLMVRVPPEDTEKLLERAHVSPMVMAGRETRAGCASTPRASKPNASFRVGLPKA